MQKFSIIAILLTLLACRNKTSINGVIINAHTGISIEGATGIITYQYRDGGITQYGGKRFTTAQDGKFHFSKKNIYLTHVEIDWLNGYALKMKYEGSVEDNEYNQLAVLMTPRDGILKLTINNETGVQDSLFLVAINAGDYIPYRGIYAQKTQIFPMKLTQNEQSIAYFSTCKGESTYLKWAFDRSFQNYQMDTVQISTSDTSHVVFNY